MNHTPIDGTSLIKTKVKSRRMKEGARCQYQCKRKCQWRCQCRNRYPRQDIEMRKIKNKKTPSATVHPSIHQRQSTHTHTHTYTHNCQSKRTAHASHGSRDARCETGARKSKFGVRRGGLGGAGRGGIYLIALLFLFCFALLWCFAVVLCCAVLYFTTHHAAHTAGDARGRSWVDSCSVGRYQTSGVFLMFLVFQVGDVTGWGRGGGFGTWVVLMLELGWGYACLVLRLGRGFGWLDGWMVGDGWFGELGLRGLFV